MARTLTINGTARTSVMRQTADNFGNPSWVFQETAYRGEIGTGNFVLDDAGSAFTVPGMKSVTFDESSSGGDARVFTGYVDTRHILRGNSLVTGTDRQWSVDVEDVNVLLDDQILRQTDSANRPAETDYARVSWLIATGAIAGASAGVTVPSGSNVNMDAIDYRGQHARDVLNDCAQKSGKNFFLYRTDDLYLFYALASGSTFTSTLQISDDSSDVDGSTTFAPVILGDSLVRSSERVFSGVRLRYKGGSVYVTNATTASSFRTREIAKTNMKIKTSTKATEQANKWLDQAASETDNLPDLEIIVPRANVNDIRAGQRMKVKLRHAGIGSLTYYRVRSRTITPHDDINYRIRLSFVDDVRVTSFTSQTYVDEEQSNATDDAATVIIDENGITVTGGTITVTSDSGATVTFDGTELTLQVIASGTISVGPNKKNGVMTESGRINTGLSYDPLVLGSFKPIAYNNGEYRVMLPYVDVGHTGLVLNQYSIKARNVNGTNKTELVASLFTTAPQSPKVSYRYFVLSKRGS